MFCLTPSQGRRGLRHPPQGHLIAHGRVTLLSQLPALVASQALFPVSATLAQAASGAVSAALVDAVLVDVQRLGSTVPAPANAAAAPAPAPQPDEGATGATAASADALDSLLDDADDDAMWLAAADALEPALPWVATLQAPDDPQAPPLLARLTDAYEPDRLAMRRSAPSSPRKPPCYSPFCCWSQGASRARACRCQRVSVAAVGRAAGPVGGRSRRHPALQPVPRARRGGRGMGGGRGAPAHGASRHRRGRAAGGSDCRRCGVRGRAGPGLGICVADGRGRGAVTATTSAMYSLYSVWGKRG